MKKFTSVSDVENLQEIIQKALQIKEILFRKQRKEKGKRLDLYF